MSDLPIIGGGGGGGKGGGGAPRAAVEAANTLRSKQIAHVVDMLGEGEWEGLIDGPAGILLNDVPVFTPTSPTNDVVAMTWANANWPISGTWNFKGVGIEWRPGSQAQSAIKKMSAASSVTAIGTEVANGTPIVAAITNTDYDVVIVGVQVDALYQQNPTNGDISGYAVKLAIDFRVDGGSWVAWDYDTIDGKCMSPYIRSYSVNLHDIDPDGPWEVRVRRLSSDDPDSTKHSVIRFVGITMMTSEKFRYPNSVLVSSAFDASQFSAVPRRSFHVKMTRCRVPVNYNPLTHTYSGTWDGTFKVAWTDDPAWCTFEMATNERFGLGEYFDEDLLDKWTLYTISQYCNQMVPNGFGGFEPRFTMNVYFQSQEEAITLLQNMASAFRSIIYYMGGQLVAVQDSPSDPVYAFNTTNVKEGRFTYSGTSGATRHTVAMVVWNNPELGYKQDIEYVEDPDGLIRHGYKPVTIPALGCTSRGQAHRLGAWALYVEQNEADVVQFITSLEGTGVSPGKIVEIYDPTRAGVRRGGRIIEMAGSVATIDTPLLLPVGTHDVSYIGDDGALLKRTITIAVATTYTTITFNSGFDPLPSRGTLFGIQSTELQAQLFRITSINEIAPKEYEIFGVAHNPSKYDFVELGLTLATRPTSVTNTVLPLVEAVTFNEHLQQNLNEGFAIRLVVSWAQQSLAMGYMISWRRGVENWSAEKLIQTNEFSMLPVSDGIEYQFRISAVSILGRRGEQLETSYTVLGEKAPPPPFDFFVCNVQPDGTRQFEFGYNDPETKPLDFKGARIRYYNGVTSDWDVMTPLEREGFYPFSPFETNQLFAGTYTFAACAEDRTKNLSDPIFISATIPDRRLGNVLVEYGEHEEGWLGIKTDCSVIDGVLEANDNATWATAPATWTLWTRWNISPDSPIVYESPTRDLSSVVSALLDFAVDADGTVAFELATSADGVAWSAWGDASLSFTSRYFKIRMTVTATVPKPVPTVRSLTYAVGGRLQKEAINDLAIAGLVGAYRIGTGDIRVPITNTYAVITRVTILAIQDTDPGWTWLLVDRNVATGPRLKFYKNGVLDDPDLIDVYIEGY